MTPLALIRCTVWLGTGVVWTVNAAAVGICNIMDGLKLGGFCPVCYHADGTEPEMDKIVAAIHAANTERHTRREFGGSYGI